MRGGLRLDTCKTRPFEQPLLVLPTPAIAILALDQGSGEAATPLVRPGDTVRVGTRIAAGGGAAADLHSPVSGAVRELARLPALGGIGDCVVIESDGRDDRETGLGPCDWRSLAAETLLERIGTAGIAGLGGAAFPAASKLALARSAGADWLVLNGAECEPWICCDDALMRQHATDVVLGAQVMLAACGAARCTIAVEDDKPEAIAALEAALAATPAAGLELATLPAVFPLGAEALLIAAVTGREVPRSGLPPDIGVVCQNVGTAAAVAHCVRDGMPLVSRVVTVTGSGVRQPANVEARLGTPVATLIAACGGRVDASVSLIAGGSLTGRALAGDLVPVTKGLNCLLVATGDDLPQRSPEMPCIRCGDCAVACPVGLLPQQLFVAARADDRPGQDRFGLDACIECGCCDYVCPSAIPLTARFRAARARRHLHEQERRRAAEARARFERHQRRLADQAEAERRAFAAARSRAQGQDAGEG
jgi:electron transport complex protein RnfC